MMSIDFPTFLILVQDGFVNGAIYALLALALVLAFTVTRVIFIPQGEFVAWGALTLNAIQNNQFPQVAWLVVVGSLLILVLEGVQALRMHRVSSFLTSCVWRIGYPVLLLLSAYTIDFSSLPMFVQVLYCLLVVVPMGPIIWRLAYQPVAQASPLVLLIISIAIHIAMSGIGLFMFGAEGARTPAFSDGTMMWGDLFIQDQQIWVISSSVIFIVLLYFFFEKTIYGKALRATAINREGARLMGIPTSLAGALTFMLCALMGVVSGILIGPITTIIYDTGFLMGLKGFVGAIIGGLVSYPLAAIGAVIVGLLEAFASYVASPYKEVIVFTLIIPVLIWLSLSSKRVEED